MLPTGRCVSPATLITMPAANPEPAERFKYTRAHRLSGDNQFKAVFDNKLRKNAGPLSVLARPRDAAHHRFGMTVSRRVGNAVQRHRIKRRLREAFRLNQHNWPGRYDLVVLVHPHALLPVQAYAELVGKAVEQLHVVAEKRRHRMQDPQDHDGQALA